MGATLINRLPPQSMDIEESLLSACLLGDAREVVDLLTPDDFYRTGHQKIFRVIRDIIKDNNEVEAVALVTHLIDAGKLEEVGGAVYISYLLNECPLAQNIEYYCQILRDKRGLRELIELFNTSTLECFETADIQAIIESAQRKIETISNRSSKKESSVKIGDLLSDRIDHYEELQQNKGMITGIPTGFIDIDELTAGLQNGDLVVLAGRPSMGKTALGFNMIINAAAQGYPCVVYSYEMPSNQLVDRAVSGVSRVDSRRFRTGYFTQEHWAKITDAAGLISDLPIYLEDNAELNYMELRRSIRQHHKKHGIKLVLVDYLQLIDGEKGKNRDVEIGSITRTLKKTAKALNIPIILISQLNRKLEERANKRPIMADLRESGSIEQDADIVAFVYRDEYYNKGENNPNKGIAEVIFQKHRNGPTAKVFLTWLEAYTKFENAA